MTTATMGRWHLGDEPTEPQKLAWIDFGIIALRGVAELFEVAGRVTLSAAMIVQAHANYARDRDEFQVDVDETLRRLS